MTRDEVDLQKHDESARQALEVLQVMDPGSQERLLLHLFRVAAHADSTDDREAALRLCQELVATIRLHRNEAYRKAVGDMTPPKGEPVSIQDTLAALQ